MAGALSEAELEAALHSAGFVDFEITWKKDVFGNSDLGGPASRLGTMGINFRATKPA